MKESATFLALFASSIFELLRKFMSKKNFVINALLLLALIVMGALKGGYQVDEIWGLGLSNHQYEGQITPKIEDGIQYTGKELWKDWILVSPEHRFDYRNVFENQKNDVHPPLYYLFLHTAYSFFPSFYSKWIALSLNFLITIVIFWQVVWLFKYFGVEKGLSLLLALACVFTMGVMNIVIFIRMYILLILFVNSLFIALIEIKKKGLEPKNILLLDIVLVGGSLTHHFFLIFAFLAVLAYSMDNICDRQLKRALYLGLTSLAGIAISFLIFPASYTHLVHGHDGKTTLENISATGFFEPLWKYWDLINWQVFGYLFMYIAFLVISLGIIKRRAYPKDFLKNLLTFSVPVLAYILIVAKVEGRVYQRYVSCIFIPSFICVFSFLVHTIENWNIRTRCYIFLLLFLLVANSYSKGVPFLYREGKVNQRTITQLGSDTPCLYIYSSGSWEFGPLYPILHDLNNITFINKKNLGLLKENKYHNYSNLIVFIGENLNQNSILSEIRHFNPQLKKTKNLFGGYMAKAYYLSS